MTHNSTTIVRLLAPWGMAWILSSALGCGGHESSAVLDAAELLERYDKVRQQNDPTAFSEFEMPEEFTVTKLWDPEEDEDSETDSHYGPDSVFFITFKLCAVVADEDMAEFTELMTTHGQQINGLIAEKVRLEELKNLSSSDLGMLKFELMKCINQCVNRPIVRSVVFSKFDFVEGG